MKRFVFYSVTVLIPVLFFVALELSLRIFGYGSAPQKLFINDRLDDSYLTINPTIAERYFTEKRLVTGPQYEIFEKEKSDSTFRIFVQGASSSAGFPYHNASFPKLLEQKLVHLYPSYNIEVINTSIVATNSYTWLDLSDEIIELEPDLVLIYGGHNEYYGALGVASSQSKGSSPAMVNLYLRLKHLRTVQFISSTIAKAKTQVSQNVGFSESLMQRMVEEPEIPYGSDLYFSGLNQYSFNMSRLLEKYEEAGIPVIISNLVSNLSDFEPFSSGSGQEDARALFFKAQEQVRDSKFSRAKELFELSRDKDLLRFRASTDLDSIIRGLADDYKAKFIDIKAAFENSSNQRLVGNDLLHEHVHPKLNGQRLMSETFLTAVKEQMSEVLNAEPIADDSAFEYAIAEVDSIYADLLIKQMMPNWPFQRGDSTQSSVSQKTSDVLSGRISWYQVLLDSYLEQLTRNPKEAVVTARVYLQDMPLEPQAYELLLKAYLAAGELKNAGALLSRMPKSFLNETLFTSMITGSIDSSNYALALSYADQLGLNFPRYRLFDRQIAYLNSIQNFLQLNKPNDLQNKDAYLNALESFIFFEKIVEAEELIQDCPDELKSDSRFVSLKRRLSQI